MEGYKLLIATDYSAPYEGNFIESLKFLHKKMNEKGNDIIYFFSPKAKDKNCIKSIQNLEYKIYFGSENPKENLRIIKNIIKQEEISIIYTHFCSLKSQVQIKLVRLFHPKLRLISHFHNHFKLEGKFPRKQLQFISYNGDLNIACSESVLKSLPFNKKKNIYVDNCINFKRLDNYRDIEIVGLQNKFVVLMFGFDYYRKGVDIAIKALNSIDSKNLVLAISLSKNRDIVEKNIIEEFGRIPEYITFLEPIEDIATYYHKADVFLTASREEGLCYSVIEAAYCKTKLISSNIPGIAKNIPGQFLFESEDYIELGNLISKVYNNNIPEKEDVAHEFVRNEFSIDKWVDRTIEEIDKINTKE